MEISQDFRQRWNGYQLKLKKAEKKLTTFEREYFQMWIVECDKRGYIQPDWQLQKAINKLAEGI